MSLRLICNLCCTAAAVILCDCAPESFHWSEGQNSVVVGRGGTRKVVDGVDVWVNGEPPRRFRVLIIVGDIRPGPATSLAELERDIVKKVRKYGGDAGIIISNPSHVDPMLRVPERSRFAVIKYVD
jgi:hypothetical protein